MTTPSASSFPLPHDVMRQKPPVEKGLTFWLFFPTVAFVLCMFVGFGLGFIPWWVNLLLTAPCYYFLIICSHDAVHSCAHGTRRWNAAVGWIGTQLFGLPYPLVRQAHLSHHARDGTPDDIEQFAYRAGLTLPLRILFGNWMYYLHLPMCGRIEWVLAATTVTGTVTLFVLCPRESLLGWFLPMQTAAYYIAGTTIWIPHGPYSVWWMKNFPFITGYHEDHHAQPGYPFHQLTSKAVRTYARSHVRRLMASRRKVITISTHSVALAIVVKDASSAPEELTTCGTTEPLS